MWRLGGALQVKVPDRVAVMQEQHQAGSIGSKEKAAFLGRCFKCGEAGHRKQDCTKVGAIDDDIPISDAPTCFVESVWDIGNVDGAWQTPKCPLGLSRTFAGCTGQRNRAANTRAPTNGCRFHALQEEEAPESEDRT